MSRKIKETNTIINYWMKVNVKSNEECWEWKGSLNQSGHGTFTMNYKTYLTHRLAWEIRNGTIPKGQYILHSCDNPKCCNPAHLFIGNQQDNMDDMIKKGRRIRGKTLGKKHLSEDEVRDIKTLYSTNRYTQKELSEIFELSRNQISLIISGKSHKDVLPEKKELKFTLDYNEDELPPEE